MRVIMGIFIALGFSAAFADDVSGLLDGNTYCRTVQTDGSFGQPVGERQHCVSFANGLMRDGANTFFGNPPSSDKYRVSVQTLNSKGKWVDEYTLGEEILENSVGAILNLK